MISLEQTTNNIIFTKGLFAVPLEAFQFNWDILNRIFVSTFYKYERFCPLTKTIQTNGGSPLKMPDDCIYPRAIGFGNASMIMPQTATVESNNWTYDRATKILSVFTNTNSTSSFKVQYLARHPKVKEHTTIDDYEVFEDECHIEIQLTAVPDISTMSISKGSNTLEVKSRDRFFIHFEGSLGEADLDLSSLKLTIKQTDISAGYILVDYDNKYESFNCITEDLDFFETWYAANLLSSLGNIKAVVKIDAMPNDINADGLLSQGRDLMSIVIDWQKEKQYWWKGWSGRI